MDATLRAAAIAGQSVHETLYGAVFGWGGAKFPCTHDEIVANPPLITGGLSPDTQVTLVVRAELFPGPRPAKGQSCTLQPDTDKPKIYQLQIASVGEASGGALLRFMCVDRHQGA